MADTVFTRATPVPPAFVPPNGDSGRAIFAAIFVMSLSSLLLELALTRLFSVILFYHFAFLAISIALLGLGAGGVYAYLRRDALAQHGTHALGARLAAWNALAIFVALEIDLHVPVSMKLTLFSFAKLTVIYLASAVPFFLTGLMFSVVFAREKARIGALYGADLVGGAAACLALVPLLNLIGGPNTVLFAALCMAMAAVIWADDRRVRRRNQIMATAFALLIAANYSGRLVDIYYTKGYRVSDGGSVLEMAGWNALSRVQVVRHANGAKWIDIDSDASTAMMSFDWRQWPGSEWEKRMMAEAPAIPNLLRPHGNFAIIGPGGGPDVLRAVGNGSPNVTGIEINPLISTTIMQRRYAGWTHNLYLLPQVHIHTSDGRSWIRNASEQFDVLQMTLVDTWASTAAGAFALSENNLYTVQAFKEYFEHLRPDGMIAITRWEFKQPREALRVVSVAMQALRELGVTDARQHFIVVSQGPLQVDGIPVTVVAKKSPFTPDEVATVVRHLGQTNLAALYMPGAPANNAFSALIASGDPFAFSRTYAFNVAPVMDGAPFFFFTIKLGQMLNHSLHQGIDGKVNLGVAVLFMVLIISVTGVLAFLVLPLAVAHARVTHTPRLFYFIAVGLGYILVEIAFIQWFVLFLGHPTYAITVVVFLMLLSSGVGSLLSRRLLHDRKRWQLLLVLIAAAVALFPTVFVNLLTREVGLPFAAKLLLSAVLLVPLGLLMGMPFPSGLRALHRTGDGTVEWAWALNAAASVLGSVLAMVIAINAGFAATLVCGLLAYLLAAVLTLTFRPERAG